MMPHLPYPRRTYAAPPMPTPSTPAPQPSARPAADLQSQFEALLDAVWKAEADWRFNDRLDMALKQRRDSAPAR